LDSNRSSKRPTFFWTDLLRHLPQPILIDTDAGVDDALALLFALRSPELSVVAITTVAGNAPVGHCTRNVLTLLHLLQPSKLPIVAEGASRPLRRRLVTAPEVHGEDGLGNMRRVLLRRRAFPRVARHAVPTIIECCRRYGKKLTVVAVGPLTNIALAFLEEPRAVRSIGRLISMGGAFRVPGNTGPVAEFNYYVDPEAAHLVLNAGLPVTVVPLDVTQQLVLMRSELEYRAARRANRLSRAIVRFTKAYMQYHRKVEGFHGGYLHDPLAVASAINPSIIQTHRLHIDIECAGRFTRGMSVADPRRKVRKGESAVDVALRVDRVRFFKLFHERMWG